MLAIYPFRSVPINDVKNMFRKKAWLQILSFYDFPPTYFHFFIHVILFKVPQTFIFKKMNIKEFLIIILGAVLRNIFEKYLTSAVTFDVL